MLSTNANSNFVTVVDSYLSSHFMNIASHEFHPGYQSDWCGLSGISELRNPRNHHQPLAVQTIRFHQSATSLYNFQK